MKKSFILGLILAIAFLLRIWQIDEFPVGFNADEANQGYSAYSLLKTGKDEWGLKLPIAPRSFGDYRSPFYTYLTIPSIAIFGLSEFAVRLPAALLGTLAVLATYLLVQELFLTTHLSLLASLFLAISPWHISLSRGAFEANLTTLLLPTAFFLFLRGLKKHRYLTTSAIFFGLNLFSYYSPRFFIPVFVIFLLFWFKSDFRLKGEKFLFLLIFGFFLLIGIYSFVIGSKARISDIGIFAASFTAPKLFLNNYLSYLSPQFFFTQGAGEATYGMIPSRGVLYLIELPFLIFAFISLAKKWNSKFSPILIWIVLAPVPAALAQGVGYHANRVAIMMPAIQILSAYGAIVSFGYLKKWFPKLILLLFYFSVILLFLASFLWSYFREAPKISAPAMSYGWREAMNYITTIENKYPKIIVSRRFSEPQIFVAFYKKWNPDDFQKRSQAWLRYQKEGLKFVDQLGTYNLGNYEFRNINWKEDKNLKNVLFVGKEDDFPQNDSLAKRIIPYPDGKPAFMIVER